MLLNLVVAAEGHTTGNYCNLHTLFSVTLRTNTNFSVNLHPNTISAANLVCSSESVKSNDLPSLSP